CSATRAHGRWHASRDARHRHRDDAPDRRGHARLLQGDFARRSRGQRAGMLNRIRLALAIVATLCSVSLFAADAPRYTFSWPLDGSGLMPRGGTTKGPAVTLDQSESPAWQQLQKKGLSNFERDRRAILAMAG